MGPKPYPFPTMVHGGWKSKMSENARFLVVFLRNDPKVLGGKSKVFSGEFDTEEDLLRTLRPYKKAVSDCEVIIWRTVAMEPEEVAEILEKL